ncbi:N-acetylglucosamine kinase [Cellulomonas sp. PhB150]|uniref:N-acetylglucosamine kinase n=1 Tax=Cellulomonas sp. PhB150 TaxID=2485188 RepID=UPI000F46BC43|nr:BadF/BadG/BcrA/BcrD ATPase family protein [Cellulomonas sp. PhB150]ROS25972.1 N-acetylglucosamine kinase-like BadF-type ATPase [Cellulomonas sp. PhB150]
MTILLAVDGGGSKTDVLALAPDGTVLGHARGGGSCPQIIGVEPALAVIDSLVRSVLGSLPGSTVTRAGIYLSGLDLPVEIATFRAALATLPWLPAALVVDNDTFALLRAGTPSDEGVAVVCGTGINCVGRRADGATARFPALGRISGDWGGGWELGEQAVWHAARAVDGRGPSTDLSVLVPSALDRPDMSAVIEDLHFGRLSDRAYTLLAPVLLAASAAGDPVARSVVERQADEIAALALTALTRLDLLDVAVPVVLGGGVLAARDAVLTEAIRTRLLAGAPRAALTFLSERPVLGAALLVLEAAGADPSAADRLRATIGGHPVLAT